MKTGREISGGFLLDSMSTDSIFPIPIATKRAETFNKAGAVAPA
jgi:hypothetical protein